MIIAVVTVRVMKVAIYKVINVITVWNGLMPTTWSVDVSSFMTAAAVCRCAYIWVGIGYSNFVFDDAAVFGDVVQMAIVKIVDVVSVLDRCVPAIGTVLVIVIFVDVIFVGVGHHFSRDIGKSETS